MKTCSWAEDSLWCVKRSTTGLSVNSGLETVVAGLSKEPPTVSWPCAKVVKEAAMIYQKIGIFLWTWNLNAFSFSLKFCIFLVWWFVCCCFYSSNLERDLINSKRFDLKLFSLKIDFKFSHLVHWASEAFPPFFIPLLFYSPFPLQAKCII